MPKENEEVEEDFKVVFTVLVKAENMEYAIANARDRCNNCKESELHCEWL